jgi:hypothetical protein
MEQKWYKYYITVMKILGLHNNNCPQIKVFVLCLLVCFSYLLPLRAWGEAMETSTVGGKFIKVREDRNDEILDPLADKLKEPLIREYE